MASANSTILDSRLERFLIDFKTLSKRKTERSALKYVLPMFPYPSGSLHMGHARVYLLSDTLAKFYSMTGYNVVHPIGWDSFGLPAENAAIERGCDAESWTEINIKEMKKQIMDLGCDFDWSKEIKTSDPRYYKWTQLIFLMLYNEGLVYRKPAPVLWDPIDRTVLANEQVDAEGRAWRSGAIAETKFLDQWFVRITHFAKQLADDLVEDGTDMSRATRIQRGWIGKCNDGRYVSLKMAGTDRTIDVFTKTPEKLLSLRKVLVHPSSQCGLAGSFLINPINNNRIPIEIADEKDDFGEVDKFGKPYQSLKLEGDVDSGKRENVVRELGDKIGPLTSGKIFDWCISRQRRWGTPIPMIHCSNCGKIHPLNPTDLPLLQSNMTLRTTKCPKCEFPDARYESDTLDTFFDSSWYFLRFLDCANDKQMFRKKSMIPVDIYLGGIEHAITHLMAARVMVKYFHSKAFIDFSEPFRRFVAVGTVTGETIRSKSDGRLLSADDLRGMKDDEYTVSWEKMSKSKRNGINPMEIVREHGSDFARFHLLNYSHPRSIRKFSLGDGTAQGVTNWMSTLWKLIHFSENWIECRECEDDESLFEKRIECIRTVRYNMIESLNVPRAIVSIQQFAKSLTTSIKRNPKTVTIEQIYGLTDILKMMYPLAPVISAQLWTVLMKSELARKHESAENVWEAKYPELPEQCNLPILIRDNKKIKHTIWIPRSAHNSIRSLNQTREYLCENGVVQEIVDLIKENVEFTYQHDNAIVMSVQKE